MNKKQLITIKLYKGYDPYTLRSRKPSMVKIDYLKVIPNHCFKISLLFE